MNTRDAFDLAERLSQSPFGYALKMDPLLASRGHVEASLDAGSAHRSEVSGAICEGMLAAACDQVGAAAVSSVLGIDFPMATLTMDLIFPNRVNASRLHFSGDYVAGAGPVAHARVTVATADGVVATTGVMTFALGRFPGASVSARLSAVENPAVVNGELIEDLRGQDSTSALGIVESAKGSEFEPRANLIGSREPLAIHGGVIAASIIISSRHNAGQGGRMAIAGASIQFLRAGLLTAMTMQTLEVLRSRRSTLMRVDATQLQGQRHNAEGTIRLFERDFA